MAHGRRLQAAVNGCTVSPRSPEDAGSVCGLGHRAPNRFNDDGMRADGRALEKAIATRADPGPTLVARRLGVADIWLWNGGSDVVQPGQWVWAWCPAGVLSAWWWA
ncbi:hypothetical protein Acsp01_29000 [Actinoplanes sp. NBRC 101535]|nr:hypothetical protein Acsp01_29000 [Actinoplanes sp. NBRC 101535]